MKAILVRVASDRSARGGKWNGPADPATRDFVYVPIPEPKGTRFHHGCRREYDEVAPALQAFASQHGVDGQRGVTLPERLVGRAMHLDPDFKALTYGNRPNPRGDRIQELQRGDVIAFFGGLRSIRPKDKRLVYALIGLYVVDERVKARDVSATRRNENAHTRTIKAVGDDIVVRAQDTGGKSGRLKQYIPIGEYRDRAYRVRRDLLEEWGGLCVKNGYIQRSANPPFLCDGGRFYKWFLRQNVPLVKRNN